jgi:hypothetical protein
MTHAPITAKFRRNTAIMMAAVLAVLAGASLGSWAPHFLPVLVIPALIAIWGWRSGTDVSADGLVIRATLGSRRVPWSAVANLVPEGKRVNAHLTSGNMVELPAVTPGDIPAIVDAAGSSITRAPSAQEPAAQ